MFRWSGLVFPVWWFYTFSVLLSRYIAFSFLQWLLMLLAGIGGVAFLVDQAELVRRAGDKDVPGVVLAMMGVCKLPSLLEKILPFILLLAALVTLQRLARRYEITAMRAAGISVWQMVAPMMGVALLAGIVQVFLLNPLSAVLLGKYEQLDSRYFRHQQSALGVSKTGIWLRQRDNQGYSLLHAARLQDTSATLQEVMVLRFEPDGDFVYRLDTRTAHLGNGYWLFRDGWLSSPGKSPQTVREYRLATDFTLASLQDSFASPETLSFWNLPRFIRLLEEAGFPALRHRLHWQTQLASPFLYATLVMVAAVFALRHPRHGKPGLWMAGGILSGFALYLFADFIGAMGISARLPIVLAAWAPPLLYMGSAASMLVYTEEG